VVEVEDAVGGLGSVDTAQKFDVSVVVGSREVAGEAPIEWSRAILGSELALKESAGDIVATELDEGQDKYPFLIASAMTELIARRKR